MEPYDPSELEGAVLGVIWKLQPCSTYAVRKAFRDSITARWNASAGAIYPLVERLAERGLLSAECHLHGKRRSKRYRLSPEGLAALQRWVGPPLTPETTAIPGDPLRARLRFLGSLPEGQQIELVEEALRATSQHVRALEDLLHRAGDEDDPFWELALGGALEVARARTTWLENMLAALG